MNPTTNSHILVSVLGGVMIMAMGMLIFTQNLFGNRLYDWIILLGWTILVLYAIIEREVAG